MKKINIYFVLECIIIVLLLAILGVLLKDSRKEEPAEVVWEEYEDESGEVFEEEYVDIVEPEKHPEIAESENELIVPEVVLSQENSIAENTSQENSVESVSDNEIAKDKFLSGQKIVVFGDSIWDEGRGYDGISEQIQNATGAIVYNCAVGGSTAAQVFGEKEIQNWSSSCFNGMVYVARDMVPADNVIKGRDACEVVKQVDFEEMDYVIISYGLNDYFSNVPVYPETYYDIASYIGALRNGIYKLQKHFPHLKIMVVSPTYTALFEGEQQYEIGEYVEAARSVADEMKVHFLDMFHILGKDEESRTKHLVDGVHLSTAGRKVYADAVIWKLRILEE